MNNRMKFNRTTPTLDMALFLLELSLEYLIYYNYARGRIESDVKRLMQEIIADVSHYIDQKYYIDEDHHLVVGEQIDNIKEILILLLTEKYNESKKD